MDPGNCEVADLPKYAIKGCETVFTIIIKDTKGDHCHIGGGHVSVELRGVNSTAKVRYGGRYSASFVPQQVGEVKLSVFVDGQQIKGSPYSIIVKDYTLVNKPTKIVNIDGSMGEPWGIAFGKNGMWAVADWSNHCVYIINGEDQLVRKFGSHGSGDGQFSHPTGVAFDSDDHLYAADCNNDRIQKFTIDGKYLLQFRGDPIEGSDGEGSDDEKLYRPRGLVVHNHKVYVVGFSETHGLVFQSDGKFLYTFGGQEYPDDAIVQVLGFPYDVTVNGNNELLVADYGGTCICIFTLDGEYVKTHSTMTRLSGPDLIRPNSIATDLYGFILVTNTANHRVFIFDKYFNFVHCFGSEGTAVGQFRHPRVAAVSANGDIYVSDHDNKRVQIFSSSIPA